MKLFSANRHAPILWVGVVLFSALVFTGCREGIVSYEIPKEAREEPAPPSAAPGGMQRPPMPGIEFSEEPEGWTKMPGGEMRVATYSVEGKAEMAALPLPAAAGMTDVMLVNMWREQVGLKPANEEELARMTRQIKVGGEDAKLFDVVSGDNRIMVAMANKDGWKWFFKFGGNAQVIEDNAAKFEAMLAGATFKAPPEMPAAPASTSAGRPDWTTPGHWEEQRAGMMQLAKYNAAGEGGATEITVVRMGGAAGGIPPNVNRWLGQVGLSSVSDDEANAMAKPVELPAGDGRIVELAGKSKDMIVIMVSQGGSTWFYKSMGEKAAVEREKTALVEFVKSVQYN